ncbi:comF family protein [Eubacterium oxidoreducens]|uniref:ComF family protein n=2 Tax=Eubacterium oxidoreducens TaxID=1732 RepID=A0A1G6ACU1_EUBOX|nr:comF family protein [Eubacterium oxidoreducens]
MKVLKTVVFPPKCPVCDKVIMGDARAYARGEGIRICKGCAKKLKWIQQPYCTCCGKPVRNERIQECGDCQRKKHFFDETRSLWVYEGEARKILERFKYFGRRDYGELIGKELARIYGGWLRKRGVDLIVPIPVSKKRMRQREYNQAALIARVVARETGIAYKENLLGRRVETLPQKNLNSIERKKNLENAFFLRENDVILKKVVLIDDIYTTGNTIDTAALVLKKSGACKVFALCGGIGKNY